MSAHATVLILPGWQDSGLAHWQTIWQREHGDTRVVQHDYLVPKRGDWMARLDEVIVDQVIPGGQPALIAAHSLGCHLLAAWAANSQHTAWVGGALLVAPPDVTQIDWPHELRGWRPAVLNRLPFASTVVASSNDPFGRLSAQQSLAAKWGSNLQELGNKGHINADSGLGNWPQGRKWLFELLEA